MKQGENSELPVEVIEVLEMAAEMMIKEYRLNATRTEPMPRAVQSPGAGAVRPGSVQRRGASKRTVMPK